MLATIMGWSMSQFSDGIQPIKAGYGVLRVRSNGSELSDCCMAFGGYVDGLISVVIP